MGGRRLAGLGSLEDDREGVRDRGRERRDNSDCGQACPPAGSSRKRTSEYIGAVVRTDLAPGRRLSEDSLTLPKLPQGQECVLDTTTNQLLSSRIEPPPSSAASPRPSK